MQEAPAMTVQGGQLSSGRHPPRAAVGGCKRVSGNESGKLPQRECLSKIPLPRVAPLAIRSHIKLIPCRSYHLRTEPCQMARNADSLPLPDVAAFAWAEFDS